MVRQARVVDAAGAANASALLAEETDLKAATAYALRKRGRSWWDIAEELGISEGVAQNLVSSRIAAAADLVSEHTKRQLLGMEVARLDDIMNAHWDDALVDVRTAELMLKVIAQRAKLLGLDALTEPVQIHQTVVVTGTSEEYVRSLQLVVGRTEPRELEAGEAG
jgi:hypothetical protein